MIEIFIVACVFQALVEKRPHVPYRDSKLTRILQETLGGNSKTTLLVTCVNSAYHAEETCSSLRFAARAQEIRNIVKINFSLSCDRLEHLMRILQDQIGRVRSQNFSRLLPSAVLDFRESDVDGHFEFPESCAKRAYPRPWMHSSRSVSRSSSRSSPSPHRFSDLDVECHFADASPLEIFDGGCDKILGTVCNRCAAYYQEHAKHTSDAAMRGVLAKQKEMINSLSEGYRVQEQFVQRLESLLSEDDGCSVVERSALLDAFSMLQQNRALLKFRTAEYARMASQYELRESFQKYVVSRCLARQARSLSVRDQPDSVGSREYDLVATAARQQRMLLTRVEQLYGC